MTDMDAYPHSQLQNVAIGIIFFFASVALISVCLRVYSRMVKQQYGLGRFCSWKTLPAGHEPFDELTQVFQTIYSYV